MELRHLSIPFEHYADDMVYHCTTQQQAEHLLQTLEARMAACQLRLNPDKTLIVYCRDGNRRGDYPHSSFDYLGYTFSARPTKTRAGTKFNGFHPAISNKAAKRIRATIRSSCLHRRTNWRLSALARICNAQVQGWINYNGAFYRSALRKLFENLEFRLVKWAMWKYKRFRGHWLRAYQWVKETAYRDSSVFVQCQNLFGFPLFAQKRLPWKSRMS